MSKPCFRLARFASALLVPSMSLAQQSPQPDPPAEKLTPAPKVQKVEKITVQASPLDVPVTEMAQPVTVLSEDDLRRKRAASIGDTLSQELGVQSSYFGAGAGRPIIRGLDGPRIRVLENGIGTLDVSTISPDHMVTSESLRAEQIEVLRGPASLLYGSGAIGGVVNVVSNLIPKTRQSDLSGDVELRTATANREKTGAANLAAGSGDFAWHVDGFSRKAADYKIPGKANRNDPDSASGRLPNSFLSGRGGGAGASWVSDHGYLGAGVQSGKNNYGIPGGEGSHIDLKQTRYDISGELADPAPGFARVKIRLGRNAYEHAEIKQSGAIATTFKNQASEGRIELQHQPLFGVKGAFGMQYQKRDFSALGEEAIIPKTQAQATGVFLVEQKDWTEWIVSGGVRLERETRRPEGGLRARNFNLSTVSGGVVWKFAPRYNFSVNLTQAQRAPGIEELYSQGAHGATATFDIGDAGLSKEISRNLDLTLRKTAGAVKWKINLFANRFRNYVFARSVDGDGDGAPDRVDDAGDLAPDGEFLVQQFSQASARFHGYEAEWIYQPAAQGWGVRVFTDSVRARLTSGGNLPRISPTRYGAELGYAQGAWASHLTALRVRKQDRVAELESVTPGYTRVDAEVSYLLRAGGAASYLIFLQGTNLLDKDIRTHTSYLKDTTPQAGRSFTLGVRAQF